MPLNATDKDLSQDRRIEENAARIARNEEAIKRQTEALEQIRDHYYPPPVGLWRKGVSFCVKVVCVIIAYLGVAETVDWIWTSRRSEKLAERYANIARRLFSEEGDITAATACLEKAAKLDARKSDYVMALSLMKGMALAADFLDNDRPPTDAEQVRVDAALSEASVLRELDPENPIPHVLIAQALLLSGENAAATASVERAVSHAPGNAAVRVSACAIQFFAGHPEAARAHLAEARRLDASLPLETSWEGILKLSVDRDAAGAAECFRAMTRRSPRLAIGHLMLGQALLATEKPDLAAVRASFGQALLLDARLTSAMQGMAETYEREGHPALSRLWLDRALAIDARYLPVLVARARIAVKTDDAKAAVADLTSAIALAPFRADLYRLRAEAREKAGDAAGAKADRETAAELGICYNTPHGL